MVLRIFMARHGFSEGNDNPENYALRGDPNVELMDLGWQQAIRLGGFTGEYLAKHPSPDANGPQLLTSTHMRTRQTAVGVIAGAGGAIKLEKVKASPFLTEQDFGIFSHLHSAEMREQHYPLEAAFYQAARDKSPYHAKPLLGESPADTQVRVSGLCGTLMRDYQQGQSDHFLVTHGVTLRTFAMAFLHIDPYHYKKFRNPENCSLYLIEETGPRAYSFKQIFNGETGQPVDIDLGARLQMRKAWMPPLPDRFKNSMT